MKKRISLFLGVLMALISIISFASCEIISQQDETDDNIQPPHQHIRSEPVRENEIPAGCTSKGSYDEVIYCADENCRAEISRETTKYEPSHSYADGACVACGEKEPTTYCLTFMESEDRSYWKVSFRKDYNQYVNEIVIPATFGNKPVKAIDENGFKGRNFIRSIIMPDSITSIGDYAFYGCNNISSIDIPDGLTEIGEMAFGWCLSFTDITIPDSVTSIGYGAFVDCHQLKSVKLSSAITKIESKTFSTCVKLESITIPDGVKSIGQGAFEHCGFTSITIPGSVKSIEPSSFDNCLSLTSITLTDGVENIGYNAFQNCRSLASITIPNSITKVANNAFSGCNNLQFSIYDGAKYLGNEDNPYLVFVEPSSNSITSNILHEDTRLLSDSAFSECSSLETLVIPAKLTSLGNAPFTYCTSLKNIDVHEDNLYYKDIDGNLYSKDGKALIKYAVKKDEASFTVPDGVTRIEDFSFRLAKSLVSIKFPDSLETIGNFTFDGCTSLADLELTSGIKSVGERAFQTCYSLKSVVMSDSLESMGDFAFEKCWALEDVELSKKLTSIGNYIFANCTSLKSIVIPDSVTTVYPNAFEGCSSLFSVTIGSGVTYISDKLFADSVRLAEVINRSSVEITDQHEMKDYAVEIHSGESKIVNKDNFVFYTYNGINYLVGYAGEATDLVLPENYNGESYEIKNYAFYQCESLVSIAFSDSVTKIGDFAFNGCTSLKDVKLSDGVTSIGGWAFNRCRAVEGIIIPDSVVSIGDYSFNLCLSLTDVYYTGTEEEWGKVSIGDNNTHLEDAVKHFEYIPET